jgi:hypothetical protein
MSVLEVETDISLVSQRCYIKDNVCQDLQNWCNIIMYLMSLWLIIFSIRVSSFGEIRVKIIFSIRVSSFGEIRVKIIFSIRVSSFGEIRVKKYKLPINVNKLGDSTCPMIKFWRDSTCPMIKFWNLRFHYLGTEITFHQT